MRLSWSAFWPAAIAHAVGALVALTLGFLLVPALSVVVGARPTATLSLVAAAVLHAAITAVFTAAMRRMDASALTCLVNLFLARLPVVALGLLVGRLAPGAAGDSAEAAGAGLLEQAGLQTGWALLAVLVGVAVGILWVRYRDGAAA